MSLDILVLTLNTELLKLGGVGQICARIRIGIPLLLGLIFTFHSIKSIKRKSKSHCFWMEVWAWRFPHLGNNCSALQTLTTATFVWERTKLFIRKMERVQPLECLSHVHITEAEHTEWMLICCSNTVKPSGTYPNWAQCIHVRVFFYAFHNRKKNKYSNE
jgi:hypothetical protein